MHKTTYTNYEQGKHTVPLDFAVAIADFYDVRIDYIAGRTNFPKGAAKPQLKKDETELLCKFSKLSERNKGKLEQFLENLLEQEQENEAQLNEAK